MNNRIKYYDGKIYDLMRRNYDDDKAFYLKIAETYGSPILELACGTGRITVEIAKKGYSIDGIDISKSMLHEARNKICGNYPNCRLYHMDMRNLQLKRKRYKSAFIAFNGFNCLLCMNDVHKFLNGVYKSLSLNGILIIETVNPPDRLINRKFSVKKVDSEYTIPNSKDKIKVYYRTQFNKSNKLLKIQTEWHDKFKKIKSTEIDYVRLYFSDELDDIIRNSGFKIIKKYGDFSFSSFSPRSPVQIIVAQKI